MSEAELTKILIDTPIDQLIELIRQKKRVALSKAASYLNVTETQVEEWVSVLEERGFLRLMYPPIGEPYIVIGTLPPEKLKKKVKEFEKKKEKLNAKAVEMEEKLTEAEDKVEATDEKFVKLQEELYKNLEGV